MRIRFWPPHDHARCVPGRSRRQARAAVTLDAIFEATIQLLVVDGMDSLTTTRVAERAGVSVGTMYQYFPHREALVYGLNERYLIDLAARIEAACDSCRGTSISQMAEALIDTYWRAKMDRPEVTRALYRSVAEMDNQALIDAFASRVDAATMAMLESASDAHFNDLRSVNLTLVTVVFGAVRNACERNLEADSLMALRQQLVAMCRAYLSSGV